MVTTLDRPTYSPNGTAHSEIPAGFTMLPRSNANIQAETEVGVRVGKTYMGLSKPLISALNSAYVIFATNDIAGELYIGPADRPGNDTFRTQPQVARKTLLMWLEANGFRHRTFYRAMPLGFGYVISPKTAR